MTYCTDDLEAKPRKVSKLKPDDKTAITYAIVNILYRRHIAIPFPLETTDEALLSLFESTMPPEAVSALNYFRSARSPENILHRAREVQLSVGQVVLSVGFNYYQFLVSTSMSAETSEDARNSLPYIIKPGHPHFSVIGNWAVDMLDLKHRCDDTLRLLDYVLKQCNTAGQITRVWPEVEKFLPNKYREALQSRARTSQMPRGIDMLYVNDRKKIATDTIALLSLLPKGDAKVRVA